MGEAGARRGRTPSAERARAERAGGRLDRALELFAQALAELPPRDVVDDDTTAIEYAGLACECGVLSKVTGDYGAAHRRYAAAWAVLRARGLTDGDAAATVLRNLAGLLHTQGRTAEAEPIARRAVLARTRALGPDHPETLADRAAWAAVLVDLGRPGDAERELTSCLRRLRTAGVDDDYGTATILHNLAVIAGRRGDVGRAAALLERAVGIKRRLFAVGDPRRASSELDLRRVRHALATGAR